MYYINFNYVPFHLIITVCDNFIGVGSMIGLKTGKIIAFGTRTKHCAICESAEHKGQKPRVHDCRRNWSGSSKAMEPDVGAELAATCENQAWCSSGNPGWR